MLTYLKIYVNIYENKKGEKFMFIKKLVKIRKGKGVTQRELAQRMGVKQPAIARTEAGRVKPSISFVEKYLSALGCRLEIVDND